MNVDNQKPYSSIFVITTSGGGGHLQAANAKILEQQLKNPLIKIKTKNIILEAGGKLFGKLMVNAWDRSQRKGNVRALEFWASNVLLFDLVFWFPVFFQTLYRLFRNRIDHVIDTQPLCLPSIVSAVRIYRFVTKKNVLIEKVLTELPTNYAAHYLRPIRRLPKKGRRLLRIMSTKPLLSSNETPALFWQKYCKLPESQVRYEDFPIRPSFKKYQNKEIHKEPLTLSIKLKSEEEKELLKNCLEKGNTPFTFSETLLLLQIDPLWKVTTLMLGSQPTQEATLQYVRNFMEVVRHHKTSDQKHLFFVFCSKNKFETIPLQKRIYQLIQDSLDYPKNLTIIPMSSQEDDVIAPLYCRSDATLTKSGGVTAMELIAVARGTIWIHKENNFHPIDRFLFENALFALGPYKGMPKWEYGNATYLGESKGAQLVTPETFSEASKTFLSSG